MTDKDKETLRQMRELASKYEGPIKKIGPKKKKKKEKAPKNEGALEVNWSEGLERRAFGDSHDDDRSVELDRKSKHQTDSKTKADQKQLSKKQIDRALKGHADAAEIKKLLKRKAAPTPIKLGSFDRDPQQHLIVGHPERWRAIELMSETDKEALRARIHSALAKDEQIKAEKGGYKVSRDDPAAMEKIRHRNVRWEAEQRFKTNFDSINDLDNPEYRMLALENNYATPEELRDEVRKRAESMIPPEPSTDYAPKAPSTPIVVIAKPKLTLSEIAARKADAEAKRQTDDRDRRIAEITSQVRAAKSAQRKPAIGVQLKEMRALLGPGAFQAWLCDLGIPETSARRFMSGAK